MEQRMQFLVDHQRGLYPTAELCVPAPHRRRAGRAPPPRPPRPSALELREARGVPRAPTFRVATWPAITLSARNLGHHGSARTQ